MRTPSCRPLLLAASLLGCSHGGLEKDMGPDRDLALALDLAGADLRGADLAAPAHDLAEPGADLATPGFPTGPGLALWLRFEDTDGPVLDSAGGAHHGVAEGAGYQRGAPGRFGRAIRFLGTDGRVRVPAFADLDFLSGGTLEFWLRLDDTTSVGGPLSRGTGNNDDNVLVDTSCGSAQVIFSLRGGTNNVTTECKLIALDTWTHVAATNDGTTLRLYLNGALVRSGPGGFLGALKTDLYVGRREQGVFPLRGSLDEVKWWNVVRGEAEVCADAGGAYAAGSCRL